MKISIITPNYNGGATLEATITSILSQNYNDLEYIVIDGNSTDDSKEILERYRANCSKLIIEKDSGQYHAIVNGFRHATGSIMGWLNSDDIYLPWTLSVVNEIFKKYPDVDWIIGLPSFITKDGFFFDFSEKHPAYVKKFIECGFHNGTQLSFLQQESMFWRKSLWEKAGGLNIKYSLAADYELWTRFARHADLVGVDIPLACFRIDRAMQRSARFRDIYISEVYSICSRNFCFCEKIWYKIAAVHPILRWIIQYVLYSKSLELRINKKAQVIKKDWVIRNQSRIGLVTFLKRNCVDSWRGTVL